MSAFSFVASILYLAGAVQGFFMGSMLLVKRSLNKRASLWLGLLVLAFSYNLLYYFLSYQKLLVHVPHLVGTINGFFFLCGPLFYLYFVASVDKAKSPAIAVSLLHLLPWAISMALGFGFFMLPAEVKLRIWEHDMSLGGKYPFSWNRFAIDLAMCLHMVVYLILSFTALRKAVGISSEKRKHLKLVLLYFLLFVAGAVVYRISQGLGMGYYDLLCYGMKLFIAGAIYTLAYTAFLNPHKELDKEVKPKYQNSPLRRSDAQLLATQITSLFETNAPYLSPDFNLEALANQLELPPQYVSQVINQELGCNFPDLVNKHRVAFAKHILLTTNEKIIAVALDSGFNNKVSFNNAFKKFTGMTPSDFRASQVPGG